ncbi:MAG: polysaccharide lyase [Verrucomicrobiota bacterium]
MRLPILLCLTTLAALHAASPPTSADGQKGRKIKAGHIFDLSQPVLFQDDFSSGKFDRWNLSVDDRYRLAEVDEEHIEVVNAPALPAGKKAVRMVVQRAPDSFRSEISLPHEEGFQERWYGERIFIPEEWTFDKTPGNDIVMQWHAIPGNGKATYPNLEISIGNDRWFVRQSFGSPQTKPTRTNHKLDETVKRGVWVSWVIHAKWSPKDDGFLKIWKDDKLVFESKGPNVYGTIGVDYTPYMKTGIYHPEWHLDTEPKRATFDQEKPVATRKIVYVTDIKIGSERARLEDITPPSLPR